MENLMNSAHKASTDAYREGWDRIFGVSDASDGITPEMIEEYVRHPNFCPFCDSPDIEGGYFESDWDIVWTTVTCLECKKQWDEIFKLKTIEEVG